MKLRTSPLKKNKKGFSLVELMVVVAIIGILAVIGIPQYQKFMAKARQAEAKTNLNAIFQAEASFFTEYNGYSTNLAAIGADASGSGLRYNAGFDNTTNSGGCANPVANSPNGTTANNDMWLIPNPPGSPATYFWATIADLGANTVCNSVAGAQVFTAASWGNPTNNSAAPNNANNNGDVFQINQARNITHLTVGM